MLFTRTDRLIASAAAFLGISSVAAFLLVAQHIRAEVSPDKAAQMFAERVLMRELSLESELFDIGGGTVELSLTTWTPVASRHAIHTVDDRNVIVITLIAIQNNTYYKAHSSSPQNHPALVSTDRFGPTDIFAPKATFTIEYVIDGQAVQRGRVWHQDGLMRSADEITDDPAWEGIVKAFDSVCRRTFASSS